jgi:hypothetical protein
MSPSGTIALVWIALKPDGAHRPPLFKSEISRASFLQNRENFLNLIAAVKGRDPDRRGWVKKEVAAEKRRNVQKTAMK